MVKIHTSPSVWFLFFFIAIAACRAAEVETPTVPNRYRTKLSAIQRPKDSPIPAKEGGVLLGEVREDHFILLGRKYVVSSCIVDEQQGQTIIHILGKPDAEGGYSVMLLDSQPNQESPLACIITWQPRDLAVDASTQTYLILPQH